MGHHNTGKSFVYQFFIRIKFYGIYTLFVKRYSGQGFMGILVGVAMTRKMFGVGQNACTLHAFHKSQGFFCYILFALSKRTVSYNRVLWIGIYIYHWRKIKMHTNAFTMFTYALANFFYKSIVLNGSQRHVPRVSKRRIQAHA